MPSVANFFNDILPFFKSKSPSPQTVNVRTLVAEDEYPEILARVSRSRDSETGIYSTGNLRPKREKKRGKCCNCKRVFLRSLSRHDRFCSIDCKSNAAYLVKVNQSIRVMQEAADAAAAKESTNEKAQDCPKQESVRKSQAMPISSSKPLHTFAEYGLESRHASDLDIHFANTAL